ncbi:MAG: OmpA family protein [Hydrogenophaga sp.]|nr:OmpA family protein [Hydrogenophaga sp.]
MKNLLAVLFVLTSSAAVAQPYNNWVSSDGQVVRSGFNECWRTTAWTPETAHPDCGDAKAAAPAPAPAAVPAAVVQEPAPVAAPAAPTKVTFEAEAIFDFDKSTIKPQGKSQLDALLSKLKTLNWTAMTVVGHTDSTGPAAYNQGLSERRADSVKSYLVGQGLPAAAIQASGQGESAPVADNATAAGRAQNRRVEVEVVGTAK